MYRKMLVCLDGSKMAEVVFAYARELSGRLGLDLDLLHVCTPEESNQLPMSKAYIDHMAEMLQAQCEAIRTDASANVVPGEKKIEAKGVVGIGYPAEEIIKYADSNDVDIIMMATHGHSGIRRWGLGGVADKVIHGANQPIWLVPAALHEGILYDTMPQRMILVPLDGSELAEAVISHVIALAKQREAETDIILINVTHAQTPRLTGRDRDLIGEDIAALRTLGENYLTGIVSRLKDAGLKAQYEQLVGDPAEEIVRYAAENHPRLIAMSTHGRSGFSHFIFGSVAESVIRRLQKTPVFLVRPPQK